MGREGGGGANRPESEAGSLVVLEPRRSRRGRASGCLSSSWSPKTSGPWFLSFFFLTSLHQHSQNAEIWPFKLLCTKLAPSEMHTKNSKKLRPALAQISAAQLRALAPFPGSIVSRSWPEARLAGNSPWHGQVFAGLVKNRGQKLLQIFCS